MYTHINKECSLTVLQFVYAVRESDPDWHGDDEEEEEGNQEEGAKSDNTPGK
jgi:hypothetical protein